MIIIDQNIPYIKGAFEPFMDVVYAKGAAIDRELVKDATALIVRTRTKCNESLLAGSKVKFVASATIGTDHIDKDYCETNGIEWAHAPGCNADGVAHYIFTVLEVLSKTKGLQLNERTLGVIGAGNVGKRVIKVAEAIGMNVLVNDPPRERAEGSCGFISLEGVLREADVITLHVPLNREGQDKTFELVNDTLLKKITKPTVFINTCRGEVINQNDLLSWNKKGLLEALSLDVWPNEPTLNADLLQLSDIATPHVAGYSINGKLNATTACIQFIGDKLNLPLASWQPNTDDIPERKTISIQSVTKRDILLELAEKTYDIMAETALLKQQPENFESFRNNYDYRYEAGNFVLEGINDHELQVALKRLGYHFKA